MVKEKKSVDIYVHLCSMWTPPDFPDTFVTASKDVSSVGLSGWGMTSTAWSATLAAFQEVSWNITECFKMRVSKNGS